MLEPTPLKNMIVSRGYYSPTEWKKNFTSNQNSIILAPLKRNRNARRDPHATKTTTTEKWHNLYTILLQLKNTSSLGSPAIDQNQCYGCNRKTSCWVPSGNLTAMEATVHLVQWFVARHSTAENLFPLCQMVERGVWEEPSDARLAHVCHDPRKAAAFGEELWYMETRTVDSVEREWSDGQVPGSFDVLATNPFENSWATPYQMDGTDRPAVLNLCLIHVAIRINSSKEFNTDQSYTICLRSFFHEGTYVNS